MFDHRRIKKKGVSAPATVVSMAEHRHSGSSDSRRYDFVLDVRPTEGAPFRVEMHQLFYIIERKPQAGDEVNVKFDPKSHETIFDFAGDHRFDLDAMRAHTAALQQQTAAMKAQFGRPGASRIVAMGIPAHSPAEPSPLAAIDGIARLVQLRDSGAITAAEFETLKAKLLGS